MFLFVVHVLLSLSRRRSDPLHILIQIYYTLKSCYFQGALTVQDTNVWRFFLDALEQKNSSTYTEIEEASVLICKHMGVFPHPTNSTVAFIGEGRATEAKIKWTFPSVIADFLSLKTIFCTGRAMDFKKPLSISAKHNLLETLPCVFHYSYWYDNYLVINT